MRVLAFFLLASLTAVAASAQEIEVASVRFNNVRAPGAANGSWLEADVTLNVHPSAGAPGQMISRVRVTLLLGFELPGVAGGERRVEHYVSDAECVALEAGRSEVRFYLAPELVKRDQMHGGPKFWGVELAAGGRTLPAVRAAYAPALASAEQRKNFQTRATAAASANEGLLQPQYLTPFAGEYPRATPSFVRREPR